MFDEIRISKEEGGKRVYGVILDRAEVRRAMRRDGLGWMGETKSEAMAEEEGEDEDIPGQIVKISISHDGEYATAVCLAAEETNETS